MALKQTTVHTLMLLLMTPLATAQSLQLVYIGRSGRQPGDNQITLECRRDGFAVASPQIFVERSDLARQPVTIVNNQSEQVTIEITQDLEGSYSCSDSGDTSTNTLELVAYPQANLSIPSSYAFQEGQPGTINCRIMPGRLSQYYRIRWMNGSLTIATSNPRSVLSGYQLHDNFSLTINNIQSSDSSTSYRCSVTIDDPQIPGTVNIIYDQLGSNTVTVYEQLTPHGTFTILFTSPPTESSLSYMYPSATTTPTALPVGSNLSLVYPSATPTTTPTSSPVGSNLELRDVILIVAGGVIVVVVMTILLIVGCMCCYIRSKHTRTTAEQKLLFERADKLEREAIEMANELPQDPDKRKMKEDLISHKTQEASKLRDQAARLPQERYTDLLEKADQKQREEDEMIKNLSSDPQIAKLQKKAIEDIRREKNALRKEAHRRMATDYGEDVDGSEQDHVQEDASDGGKPDATAQTQQYKNKKSRMTVV